VTLGCLKVVSHSIGQLQFERRNRWCLANVQHQLHEFLQLLSAKSVVRVDLSIVLSSVSVDSIHSEND